MDLLLNVSILHCLYIPYHWHHQTLGRGEDGGEGDVCEDEGDGDDDVCDGEGDE